MNICYESSILLAGALPPEIGRASFPRVQIPSYPCLVMNNEKVLFKEVVKDLGVGYEKARYWVKSLEKEGLVEPEYGAGNKMYLPQSQVEHLFKVKEIVETDQKVTTAIRLIQQDLTPEEAINRHDALTNQLEAAQKKVLDLRRDPWWVSIKNWFKTKWSKLLGRT